MKVPVLHSGLWLRFNSRRAERACRAYGRNSWNPEGQITFLRCRQGGGGREKHRKIEGVKGKSNGKKRREESNVSIEFTWRHRGSGSDTPATPSKASRSGSSH